MAKKDNQKLKMLYLAKIFYEYTDEEHGLSLKEIASYLEDFGISADRKVLYQDFEELRRFGMDIIQNREGRSVKYSLASREFELPELKLLVDSVQSAKFLSESKSRSLIKKLESLASVHDAKKLHRQVIISGRVKAMTESIYYNIDKIHNAIGENKQISFKYFRWDVDKKMVLKHGGAAYHVSPWALVNESENYYLIGYDGDAEIIKHFRVDKMTQMAIENKPRQGAGLYKQLDLLKYSQSLFGMFAGEETVVTLRGTNAMAGPIIDRFGKDIMLVREDAEHFHTRVTVAASDQFIGWVIGLGEVEIIAPESMVEKVKKRCQAQSVQTPVPYFTKIECEKIEDVLSRVSRQYLVGNLKRPQDLEFIGDDRLEIGITDYDSYTTEPVHYHTEATEYQYMISGRTKFMDVETGEEFEFRKGDFYCFKKNTVYAQKSEGGTRILFIKVPSVNDKHVVEAFDKVKKWYESY